MTKNDTKKRHFSDATTKAEPVAGHSCVRDLVDVLGVAPTTLPRSCRNQRLQPLAIARVTLCFLSIIFAGIGCAGTSSPEAGESASRRTRAVPTATTRPSTRELSATDTATSGPEPTMALTATPEPTIAPTGTPAPTIYTVVAGDTLYLIGQRFGVSLAELIAANPDINPDSLQIGQQLVIPGVSSQSEPATAPEEGSEPAASDPAPAPAESSQAFLPGLLAADVTVNLEQRGFECTSADKGVNYYYWSCTDSNELYDVTVELYGRTLSTLDYVNAVVLQFGAPMDELALPFLGYIATVPYDGAEPERARAWVEQTLPTITTNGDVRTATFGGVQYELFGWPPARNLKIGSLP